MRLEFSNRLALAKRVLAVLAATDGSVKGADLAREVGTTAHYLPHVLRPLVAAGWVGSEPGPTGGYHLLGGGRVTLLDLVIAIDGPIDERLCALTGQQCTALPCEIHEAWVRARSTLAESLAATTVLERGMMKSSGGLVPASPG